MRAGVSLAVAAMLLMLSAQPAGLAVRPEPLAGSVPTPAAPMYADLADLISLVNESDIYQTILSLQSFGTRYCQAPNNPEVADFIDTQMARSGATTHRESFLTGTFTRDNVVAELAGTGPGDSVIIVGGHFDSISDDKFNDAPGADDNGSGTAALMLMAQIMAQYRWNSTVRFVAFNAEEVGLHGSRDYAQDAAARGDNITAVFNMDMIGYNGPDNDLEIFYTNESQFVGLDSEFIADSIVDSVTNYGISLTPVKRMFIDKVTSECSDHYPFWENGFEAVLLIERHFPDYPYYHTTEDTVDKLNMTYAASCIQAVLGAVCGMAGINSTRDLAAPAHSSESPADGSFTVPDATISVEVTDGGGLNVTSIQLLLDGFPVAATMTDIALGKRVSYATLLEDEAAHTARIRAYDLAGNLLDWNWTFTADGTPPAAPTSFSIGTISTAIRLNWQASSSTDVEWYRVFKSSTPEGFNWETPLATKDASTLSHSDTSAASTLGASFYAVRPVDFAGNLGPATEVLGKVTTQVYSGWTMLGNPLNLTDSRVEYAMQYLGSYWTETQSYDTASGNWTMFAKSMPAWLRTMDSIEPGQGFWLKVSTAALKLCIQGRPVMSAATPLLKGWNLVAFPGYSPTQASVALAGVPYDGLVRYDYFAGPYRMVDMGGTEYMQMGQGYWVHVTENCVWTFEN